MSRRFRSSNHSGTRIRNHKMQPMFFKNKLPNNLHHRLSHSSNRRCRLGPLVMVQVIRGVLLDAALVVIRRGLLPGQVLVVLVAADGLYPLLDMERFLRLHRRQQQQRRPLLGSPLRAPRPTQQRSQRRRSMLIFLRLT